MEFFNNICVMDGDWTVDGVIRQIAEHNLEEDPFYVMDLGEVVKRYQRWTKLMPRVKPFYAVKCNNDRILLRTLAALGAGFDCASRQEIELVTGIGVAPERMIFAHTTKMPSHIRHAAQVGVTTTTFDSCEELEKIKNIMPHAKLVLRIRCDAKAALVSLGAKFGCDPNTEAPQLLRMAAELGLQVIGVSFHVGSGVKEIEAYARGVKFCAELFKLGAALGFQMRLVDIGGGFPGDTDSSIREVSLLINEALKINFPDESVRVIAEPGRYFACAAYTLAACIFAKRQVWQNNEKHTMYYMNDGIYGSLLHRVLHNMQVTAHLVNRASGDEESSSVWGPTCDSLDCILPSTRLPPLHVGSWLMFRDMGAYTRSIATTFNGFEKATVQCIVVDRGVWSMLKESQMFCEEDLSSRSRSPDIICNCKPNIFLT